MGQRTQKFNQINNLLVKNYVDANKWTQEKSSAYKIHISKG